MFEIRARKAIGELRLDVDLATDAPIAALFAPSGAGKTTLLDLVAGLRRPDSGRIAVGGTLMFDSDVGVDLPPEVRRLGYVFQDRRLFPHLTVRGNLLYGRRSDGGEALEPFRARWPHLAVKKMRQIRNLERGSDSIGADPALGPLLDLLGIGHLLDRWPATLSGGEAQRVAIGRALLSSPRALLFDEPLSHLDRARRHEVLGLIARLRDETKLPMLYVTHDASEIERLGAARFDL